MINTDTLLFITLPELSQAQVDRSRNPLGCAFASVPPM
jgi:hypothetical protein